MHNSLPLLEIKHKSLKFQFYFKFNLSHENQCVQNRLKLVSKECNQHCVTPQ